MTRFVHQPPTPTAPSTGGFFQQIQLVDGRDVIAAARWHAPAGGQGVAQILELEVLDDEHTRKGQGSALLGETMKQIAAYFRVNSVKPRRVWINVEQKSQIIGRAFLTQHGMHHVATIPNLLLKQDALVYMKGLD